VQCALVLALALTSTFERLAVLANLSALVLYATCCVAMWQLRRRDVRTGGTPFQVPAPALVVVLACLAIGWILTSITLREWMAFALALGAAAVIFAVRRPSGDYRRAEAS
jgi:amino acid transporter